jgi:CO dehydrogenase/acetyl-CoA synthase alpha subunit
MATEPSVERLTAAAARVDVTQKQLQAVHSALVAQIVHLEQQLQQAVKRLGVLQQDAEAALVSKAVSARQVEILAQEVADLRTSNMSMRLLLQHQQQQQQREAAGF